MSRDQLALSLNLGIFRTGHVLKQVVGAKSAGKPQSQTLFLQPITARADNQMNQSAGHPAGALASADPGNVPGHHWFWFWLQKRFLESFKPMTLRTYIYSFNSQQFPQTS